MNTNILEGLNKQQKQAVLSKSKHILVLAGAGTGKTTVLARRIANIVNSTVSPRDILALTFTNKAASEIKDRVDLYAGQSCPIDSGTFHSICAKYLREIIHNLDERLIGFQIIDGTDQKRIIKDICEEAISSGHIPRYIKDESRNYHMKYLSTISKFKDDGYTIYGSLISKLYKYSVDADLPAVDYIAEKYEEFKLKSNVLDFGDLISYVVHILKNNKKLGEAFAKRYKHILVDEFQDTNKVQFELVDIMSKYSSLFVVGDDDQSIYGWRGAVIENIINFGDFFDSTEIIKLEDNYRSTSNILDAANAVISNNKNRHGKKLRTEKDAGPKIKECCLFHPNAEGKYVVGEIKDLIYNGVCPSNIAVLYRSSHISRPIETELFSSGLDYEIIGGLKFWERKEIKDILAYLQLSVSSKNNVAFTRIINLPSRSVGPKKVDEIKLYSKTNDQDSLLVSAFKLAESKKIKGKAGLGILSFVELIKKINFMLKQDKSFADIINHILDETDIMELVYSKEKDRLEEITGNLMELVDFFRDYEKTNVGISKMEMMNNVLEYAALTSSNDKNKNVKEKVTLMTIHAAKGLEYEYVFITGFESGVFPSDRSLNDDNLEEERRLAYVAITRAKRDLRISYSQSRFNNHQSPHDARSQFIYEIDANDINLIDRVSAPYY
jgi:DNA helicase-2/ATP-dependent DNA helicase PcrA